MNLILVNALFITLASGLPPNKNNFPLDGRIVGGEDIDISQVPWQISLEFQDYHLCGGSIIADRWVVTAGHCTYLRNYDQLSIRAGTSIRGFGGQTSKIAAVHPHPNFDDETTDYDICVLELSTPLMFDDKVAPINLPSSEDSWAPGTEAYISGWGVTTEGDRFPSDQLQEVTVDIVDWDSCREVYDDSKNVTERMMCAGVIGGGKDSCQGDSGGPLAVDDVLAGIVSWGQGCGQPGYPGVYANVPVLRSFIKDTSGI